MGWNGTSREGSEEARKTAFRDMERAMLSPEFEPRKVCQECRRPESVCYCKHISKVDTKTRIVLLQHARERDMPIGTARMASLCLPNSELHVGVNFDGSKELDRALSDPSRPAILLYPGENSIDVAAHPPAHPVTLVVVDGTWWQAKKLIRSNPRIAALPRYAFVPDRPSEYRIRKEPDDEYVSTIEALAHMLGILEGDRERFESMLHPFRAMIDSQIACKSEFRDSRHLRNKKALPRPHRPRVPRVFAERPNDMVCVVAEANAWPYLDKDLTTQYPDELVHWVAYRRGTGEVFEGIARPRHPLAPRTLENIELRERDVMNAPSLDETLAKWGEFLRPTDVVCSWGHYAPTLFRKSGGTLPHVRLDLRDISRNYLKRKVGTLEQFCESVDRTPKGNVLTQGRGGKRLSQTVNILNLLIEVADDDTRRMT